MMWKVPEEQLAADYWAHHPGVHDIPESKYHADRIAISNSWLGKVNRSPLHLVDSLLNPMEQTPAMALGSLVHSMLLEPDRVDDRFATIPKGTERRSNKGKDAWAKFVADNAGKTLVTDKQRADASRMFIAANAHPKASLFLQAASQCELSMIWNDNDGIRDYAMETDTANVGIGAPTGYQLRGRVDGYCPELKTVFDVKTTADASPANWPKSMANFRYYVQAAYYLDGANALDLDVDHFVFICIESSEPHGVAIYRIGSASIELGRAHYCRDLNALQHAIEHAAEHNQTPGYPDQIMDCELPGWAFRNAA